MPEIMIFKAGKYAQGDWPKERVQKMVDAYNPEKNAEAPVVIGHRFFGTDDEYQDAHGWVSSLRMDGAGKVFAQIPEFSADVKKKIAEGKLRYVSAELYESDKIEEGSPPYLKAVALLGRDTPAVSGTKVSLFSLLAGGGLSVDESEHIAAFTRKASAEEIKNLTKQEGGGDMEELERLKAELAAEKEKAAAFAKENEAFKSADKKQEAAAYFGKLREEGKLPPALFEKAVALDVALKEEESKELRALVSGFTQIVDLSGKHIADKRQHAGSVSDTLTAKIRVYQKEKGFKSFEDAANALSIANPELFKEAEA